MIRGTVWCPICPSKTIWGKCLFFAQLRSSRSSETVGRRGPKTSPIVSLIIRGTYGAQSSNLILQKNLPWTPPPPLNNHFNNNHRNQDSLNRCEFTKIIIIRTSMHNILRYNMMNRAHFAYIMQIDGITHNKFRIP